MLTAYSLQRTKKNPPLHARGFSIIEMVVTIAIFAIISTVVIVRNAQFDNETLLHGLAYDIALSIRQAQQYGINVRGTAGTFEEPYGVHFDSDEETYELYRDLDENGEYDPPGELLETFTIGRGARVSMLCDLSGGGCVEVGALDVIFRRPNPDAIINNGMIGRASVELVSARGEGRRLIIIESTGQLSIQRVEEEE